ncbi:Mov34/MPN/PAD-1 family protein (plasmid) [Pseudomonas luteola]|uniref:Mov34/MPN/PAD-1 family protein n=1 Tax=Pseudomonas luteola TaxID=47886 RepID=UPI003DA1AA9A
MQFVAEWSANQGRNLIYIHPEVLDVFKRHIQVDPADLEGGGLLLGYVRGSHLEITEATIPTRFDRRFRTFFERMKDLHEHIAQKRWTDSNGLVRYIGEWHTHPQDHPSPSGLDLTEWRKLAVKRKDKRPVLGLIVGRKSLYVKSMESNGYGAEFCPAEI